MVLLPEAEKLEKRNILLLMALGLSEHHKGKDRKRRIAEYVQRGFRALHKTPPYKPLARSCSWGWDELASFSYLIGDGSMASPHEAAHLGDGKHWSLE